jgi:hypothetical protein
MHDLELPAAPQIESNLNQVQEGYSPLLRAPALPQKVCVSLGDLDVQMSDSILVCRGESVTLTPKTFAWLDELKVALKCCPGRKRKNRLCADRLRRDSV